jgi:rare lipoprotein A
MMRLFYKMKKLLALVFFVVTILLVISGCSPALRYHEEIYSSTPSNYDSLLFNYLKFSNSLKSESGIASYYAKKFNGRKTSSGEIFNNNDLTAAHKEFPFNTIVRVTHKKSNKLVIVRINDRLHKNNNRIIDLTQRAAKTIGIINDGVAEVIIDVLQWGS